MIASKKAPEMQGFGGTERNCGALAEMPCKPKHSVDTSPAGCMITPPYQHYPQRLGACACQAQIQVCVPANFRRHVAEHVQECVVGTPRMRMQQ